MLLSGKPVKLLSHWLFGVQGTVWRLAGGGRHRKHTKRCEYEPALPGGPLSHSVFLLPLENQAPGETGGMGSQEKQCPVPVIHLLSPPHLPTASSCAPCSSLSAEFRSGWHSVPWGGGGFSVIANPSQATCEGGRAACVMPLYLGKSC